MQINNILMVEKLIDELADIIYQIKEEYNKTTKYEIDSISRVSSKLRGSLKRKSMDLTRALTEMRKS